MEIRIWNWCKQAVLVTTGKWIKLIYFFVPFRTFMSVDISITFFLRKPIQIAYKLKCSKTQQVWLSFIFNNELKYFWRHFFLSCTIVFTRHFWIIYNNKIVVRRLHLNLEEKPRDLPSVWIITRYLQKYSNINLTKVSYVQLALLTYEFPTFIVFHTYRAI